MSYFLKMMDSEELWERISLLLEGLRELFTVQNEEYVNLGIAQGELSTVSNIIIGLFCGIIVAVLFSVFNRRVYGAFVRALSTDGANAKERAKTLGELGFLKNATVRHGIRTRHAFHGFVRCVEEDEFNEGLELRRGEYYRRAAEEGREVVPFVAAKYEFDLERDHFYLRPEVEDIAERRFSRRGTGWLSITVTVIASILLLYAVIMLLPELLQLLDNFVGMFKADDGIL